MQTALTLSSMLIIGLWVQEPPDNFQSGLPREMAVWRPVDVSPDSFQSSRTVFQTSMLQRCGSLLLHLLEKLLPTAGCHQQIDGTWENVVLLWLQLAGCIHWRVWGLVLILAEHRSETFSDTVSKIFMTGCDCWDKTVSKIAQCLRCQESGACWTRFGCQWYRMQH